MQQSSVKKLDKEKADHSRWEEGRKGRRKNESSKACVRQTVKRKG